MMYTHCKDFRSVEIFDFNRDFLLLCRDARRWLDEAEFAVSVGFLELRFELSNDFVSIFFAQGHSPKGSSVRFCSFKVFTCNMEYLLSRTSTEQSLCLDKIKFDVLIESIAFCTNRRCILIFDAGANW